MSGGTLRRPGVLRLRPMDIEADAGLVHRWVTAPHAGFWGMQDAGVVEVAEAYAALAASPHEQAWIGTHDGEPAFLAETYDPAHHALARHHRVRPGDLGMHFLCAPPPPEPVPGFTRAVITAVLRHCFADRAVQRVVVEPDARNERVHVLNAAVGFHVVRRIELPDKTALLSLCTRERFERATAAVSATTATTDQEDPA